MHLLIKILKFLWHLIPFKIRIYLSQIFWWFYRRVYITTIPAPAKIKFDSACHFYVFGFFSSNLSHKTASDLLLLEFDKNGIEYSKIDISPLHFQTANQLDLNNIRAPQDGDNVVFVVNPDIFPLIRSKIPRPFLDNKYQIAYWVYELDKLPTEWQLLIDKMNEIWVPSEFVKQCFAQYSDIKIRVLPHAVGLSKIDTDKYKRTKIRREYNIFEDTFIAINSFSFSSSMERKHILGCIEAFEKAFNKNDNCILFIRYINEKNFPAALDRLKTNVEKANCNIRLIDSKNFGGGLEALYRLYAMSDVLLSLQRSEGFGLQIAEAMLFRLPVITTNYSAPCDFANKDNSMLVKYKLIPAKDPDNIYKLKDTLWADADLVEAANYLKLLRHDPQMANNLVDKALLDVKQHLSGCTSF